MTTMTEVYQNKIIKIQDNKKLLIDNKPIQISFDNDSGKWSTNLMPYIQYDDLLALAKQAIADSEEFK